MWSGLVIPGWECASGTRERSQDLAITNEKAPFNGDLPCPEGLVRSACILSCDQLLQLLCMTLLHLLGLLLLALFHLLEPLLIPLLRSRLLVFFLLLPL